LLLRTILEKDVLLNLAHNVHQLVLRTRFFALTKFSMLNGSHMDAHRIYDLTVVHLFKCIFNLGPRAVDMLRALRYLNPVLLIVLLIYS